MNIVSDTSAIIAVLLGEGAKEAVIEATQDASLIAPASMPYEIGNAFTAMFKRHTITIDEVLKALQVFEAIPIRLVDVDLGQAVVLASEMNLYAYDAYMVEVAVRYRAPLLTLDKRLAEAAKNQGVETNLVR
jgi:predicted nucleic acid-binding protein